MPNVTRREFFRIASVVGGAVVFNIEIKQPFAKLLAEKIMEHPAARKVDAAYPPRFRCDDVVIRTVYWSEKYQERFIQLFGVHAEVYDLPGGVAADMASDAIARAMSTSADYALKDGPHDQVIWSA